MICIREEPDSAALAAEDACRWIAAVSGGCVQRWRLRSAMATALAAPPRLRETMIHAMNEYHPRREDPTPPLKDSTAAPLPE